VVAIKEEKKSSTHDIKIFIEYYHNRLSKSQKQIANDYIHRYTGEQQIFFNGYTALMYASEYNSKPIAEYLIEHGSDPEIVSCTNHPTKPISAISIALRRRYFELFNYYLEHSNPLRAVQQNRGSHNACIHILEKILLSEKKKIRHIIAHDGSEAAIRKIIIYSHHRDIASFITNIKKMKAYNLKS